MNIGGFNFQRRFFCVKAIILLRKNRILTSSKKEINQGRNNYESSKNT